jgi:release factor glutamine methyltransferase
MRLRFRKPSQSQISDSQSQIRNHSRRAANYSQKPGGAAYYRAIDPDVKTSGQRSIHWSSRLKNQIMSISIAAAILEATQILRRAGVPEARREAASLLTHTITKDRTFLVTHAEELLDVNELETFREYVARRAAGEPLQYITGRQYFYGLEFEVTRDVLIPRPETELLVEAALDLIGNAEARSLVCDVGTGSGCIAIALLHNRPGVRAVAVDVSEAALRVAARNAERHSVNERIHFTVSDCFAALEKNSFLFDLVVSNPPYVGGKDLFGLQREVREHEPRVALTPGDDGLSIIRRLLSEAPAFLVDGGYLLLEIGFDQRAAVERLIDASVWKVIDMRQDLQGIPRTIALRKLLSEPHEKADSNETRG